MGTITKIKSRKKKRLWELQQGICSICNLPITNIFGTSFDHINPKKLGGIRSNSNLALVHKRCNGRKGHNTEYVWEPEEEEARRLGCMIAEILYFSTLTKHEIRGILRSSGESGEDLNRKVTEGLKWLDKRGFLRTMYEPDFLTIEGGLVVINKKTTTYALII